MGWDPQPPWEAAHAYADGDDAHHEACLKLLETDPGSLIVPALVITEVAYLIASSLGWQAETRFLGDLAAGETSLEPVDSKDILRIAELVARYHDLPLGAVDVSVIADTERLGATEVATLDRTSPWYARAMLRRSTSFPTSPSEGTIRNPCVLHSNSR